MHDAPSTIKHVTYSSERHGPKLLVLGAVHGNEPCGPTAINRVLAEFDAGEIALERGEVTFVPVCNPEAYRRGVRFVERNLNRFLVPMEEPDTYEARLGNMLCPLLEQCDVLLDLHSYTSGDLPFVFVDQNGEPAERAFAESLGTVFLATGWEQAYSAAGRKSPENPDEPTGTTEYARRFGAIAATIECGQHNGEFTPDVAYVAIHNALRHFGLIQGNAPPSPNRRLIIAQSVVYKARKGKFAKPWKGFSQVKAGETIAVYDDGEVLEAPQDGFLIMPHQDTPPGTEWYYFGVGSEG